MSGHPIRTSSSVRARTVRAGGHDAKVLRAATSQDILELRRRKCNKCEIAEEIGLWLICPVVSRKPSPKFSRKFAEICSLNLRT